MNTIKMKPTEELTQILMVLIHLTFAKNCDLASLKSEVEKLDTDMLKTFPIDLSKLSDVVKMMLGVYKKLIANVNPH